MLGITPSQTVGPYFAMRLPWPDGPYVVPEGTPGAITPGAVTSRGAITPRPALSPDRWVKAIPR